MDHLPKKEMSKVCKFIECLVHLLRSPSWDHDTSLDFQKNSNPIWPFFKNSSSDFESYLSESGIDNSYAGSSFLLNFVYLVSGERAKENTNIFGESHGQSQRSTMEKKKTFVVRAAFLEPLECVFLPQARIRSLRIARANQLPSHI